MRTHDDLEIGGLVAPIDVAATPHSIIGNPADISSPTEKVVNYHAPFHVYDQQHQSLQ